jgi:hypothetical protein
MVEYEEWSRRYHQYGRTGQSLLLKWVSSAWRQIPNPRSGVGMCCTTSFRAGECRGWQQCPTVTDSRCFRCTKSTDVADFANRSVVFHTVTAVTTVFTADTIAVTTQLAQSMQLLQLSHSLQPQLSSLVSLFLHAQSIAAPRRSARIQTQIHAKPTQESTDVAPPQPITQREGERSRIVSSPPRIPRFRQGSPGKTFAASPAGYTNPEICEHVDVRAKCLIYMDSLYEPGFRR